MKKTWKDVTSEEELETISVKLSPLWGVAPGVYVPLLWGLILATALFFLLFFPGIRRYGTVVTIETVPAGASVYIDGVLRGKTPLETFVSAGEREIRAELTGFENATETISFRGRSAGTLVAPLRATVILPFTEADREEIRARAVADFAAWSLGTDPGGQFQHPPVARDGARALWAALSTPAVARADEKSPVPPAEAWPDAEARPDRSAPVEGAYLRNLLAHARPHQIADLTGAALRVQNPGGVLHAGSLARVVHFFTQLDTDYQDFFRLAENLFPEDLLRAEPGEEFLSAASEWSRKREDGRSTSILVTSGFLEKGLPPDARTRKAGGLTFAEVPAGPYITGYPLHQEGPSGRIVDFSDPFWIQADLVTRREFALFASENDQWAPEESDDPHYLQDWPENWRSWIGSPSLRQSFPEAHKPVRFVSRPAAEAFARWIQERALGAGEIPPGTHIGLPSSEEWEYAAFLDGHRGENALPGRNRPPGTDSSDQTSDQGAPGALGLSSMQGVLWQWTRDWYGENGHIIPPSLGYHATVRGGSFANARLPAPGVRGSQPPEWATPFLGFRLVLTEPS
ncbi:hypothetical protein AU468_14185 [Alkalispirochaeta sphaeroplastigenens]|uniref:PEGA domain-containing protein n=1 Tax=Alkalispirochaeta sphaeroplastigenens TaxID=1187066 RepID=A0A2S4JFM2_9SPIO|nr:SUMF1/EgtB/PvdO family nonheme iron enzyme [Alkalispirochaeta sphaeroplastigenens]POQ98255.1 hypothetical protein AU468_14185 [Alkalispirochaeta sphaeroplastigenens]